VGAVTAAGLDEHYTTVLDELLKGRVVPFLGAGVNLCGRPRGIDWQQGRYLPSGPELSRFLAQNFSYPPDEKPDLLRVSQYAAVNRGTGPLYEELHRIFDADYPATDVHQFFAALRGALRAKHLPAKPTSGYELLVVTTNYDDLLERAFRAAGEPFDLVTYVAEGDYRGKFWHWPPSEEGRPIERPNEYRELSLDRRTVILKIHGAVNRTDPQQDSYVITEDHYIDFLARTDISNLIPVTLAAELKRSHFLFLGYSLSDWNLRVILQRIWGEQKLSYKSWSIQLGPSALEKRLWERRDVEILDVSLEDYIAELGRRLAKVPEAPGET
jgi:SIR2-like protein